jgi:hypothetical protein
MRKMKELADDIALSLPKPLADAYDAFMKERNDQPFRKVHRLIDLIEVFCKLYTVTSVATFLDALRQTFTQPQHDLSEEAFIKIKVMLSAGLKTPSLGIWWKFARDITTILQELNIPHILPNAEQELLSSKSTIKKAFDGENNLIAFRNNYAHGATPSDEACFKDLETVWPKVMQLLQDAHSLRAVRLLICDTEGDWYETCGAELISISENLESLKGHTLLCHNDRAVDLYPLLSFRITKKKVDFFFYNDYKDKHANYLNYPSAEHFKDTAMKKELLSYIPIEEWKKIGSVDTEPFKQQIESLTEIFKGRKSELSQIASFLTSDSLSFLCVWGPPGVGKSALLARTAQITRYHVDVRKLLDEGDSWSNSKIYLLEYFIRRGATDTANQFFDSVNQRLDQMFTLRLEYGKTEEEKHHLFHARVQLIRKHLNENELLIFIIDGLDEVKHGDPLIGLLPRFLPKNMKVIYGARPKQELRFTFYNELEREQRLQFDLGGLSKEDIRAVLMEHVSKYELDQVYIEKVLLISEGNPLYLKLLCQGLDQKTYTVNHSEGLPRSMDDLYESALLRLEKDFPGTTNFLLFIAAAKDFVSTEMISSWLKLDTPHVRNNLLYASLEFLYENPLTEAVEDYQLFHESLREFLKRKYPKDIELCSERICDWSIQWEQSNGDYSFNNESLLYAMQFATEHIYESYLSHKENQRNKASLERRMQLFELTESEKWRSLNFETCGNGESIGKSYYYLQKILASEDTDGLEVSRFLNYATSRYLEPTLRYMAQRKMLMQNVQSEKLNAHLERVPLWAKMGERDEEKLLLSMMPLWTNQIKENQIPSVLNQKINEWLENNRNTAIKRLWIKTLTNNHLK